jgi:RNA polymerase primary sigma factor
MKLNEKLNKTPASSSKRGFASMGGRGPLPHSGFRRATREEKIPGGEAEELGSKEDGQAEVVTSDSTQSSMLHLYLREIGEVRLLTPAEDLQLAEKVRQGDAEARERMIKANLRLVVKIARDYENLGLPLLDLINEGNMGLMKGVERFDPTKGAKLSTYASWWIKQSIKRALANQSKTIRLPVHVVDKVAHLRRAEVKLRELFDREPTDEELGEAIGLKPQRVREYRQAAKAPVSLETPLGDDESDSDRMSEVVADSHAEAPFERLARSNDSEMLKEALSNLTEREQDVLKLRFGLDDKRPLTLEEIGERYGLTRERIRQIEGQGLKKLRSRITKRDLLAAEAMMTLSE